ncbi:MAG: peptidyl-prolyl cis-trans isomerase, partial [Desulfobacterales bacterium]
KTQPMVKARYLAFRADDYRSGIAVSKEEVEEYYEENLDAFKKPESVQARHILLKVEEDADESTVASVRQKADDIYRMVIDGQDFAELAKTYSDGPTRDTGGFLGTFERGTMVEPFEEKAFSMSSGDVSEPVRTDFGWHIIKVEEKHPETTLSVEDADAQIRGILSDSKAKLAAQEDAFAAYDATYGSDDFSEIASSIGKPLQETDFFDRTGPSGITDADRFAAIAFDLGDGGYSEVEEFSDGYYLLQLMEKKPPEVLPLDTVRDRVAQDVLARKKVEKAESEARRYLEMITSGKTLSEAASAAGKNVIETGFFGRGNPIPAIGSEPAFSEAAFGLSESDPSFGDIVQGQSNIYLIRLKDRRKPEAAAFESDAEDVKRQLLNRKQASVFRSWIEGARQRSDIVIEAAFQE